VTCWRCEERPVQFVLHIANVDGGTHQGSRGLCVDCASFVCAAVDGRPLYCAGAKAKHSIGPEPLPKGFCCPSCGDPLHPHEFHARDWRHLELNPSVTPPLCKRCAAVRFGVGFETPHKENGAKP
jgi:hypothetical protein